MLVIHRHPCTCHRFFPGKGGNNSGNREKIGSPSFWTQSAESVLLRPPLHYQALERQGERGTSSQRKRALPQWVQRCRKRFDFSRLQAIPIPEAIIEPLCVSSITYLSDLLTLVVHSSIQNYNVKKPSYTSFLKCRLRVRDSKLSLHRNLRSHQVKPTQIHRYPRLQILYNEGEMVWVIHTFLSLKLNPTLAASDGEPPETPTRPQESRSTLIASHLSKKEHFKQNSTPPHYK